MKTSTDSTKKLEERQEDTLKLKISEASSTIESNNNPEEYRQKTLNMSFDIATLFNLKDTIKADFNGDGATDKAIFIKDNETSGIIYIHGKTNEKVRIGFGEQFAHMTEFDWVDYWGLVEDKKTSKTAFDEDGDIIGSKEVTLQNPSIALGADELGGGLITFINGEYVWIHQTC
tara:strand:- start:316 stop:837 length:522 start_codon:yes stop_codon:yes gene_type:complete